MGKCGRPTLSQMQWLRQRANLTTDSHTTNTRAIQDKYKSSSKKEREEIRWTSSPLFTDVFTKDKSTFKLIPSNYIRTRQHLDDINILVIRRSGRRSIKNLKTISKYLDALIAVYSAINVYTHTERALPSLAEQIAIFSNAHIIIAPHGAGLLFSVFASEHACVIELMFPGYPTCYARMAYLRRQDYMMSFVNDDRTMHMETLHNSLMQCMSKRISKPSLLEELQSVDLSKIKS
jgi:hypothetical protein